MSAIQFSHRWAQMKHRFGWEISIQENGEDKNFTRISLINTNSIWNFVIRGNLRNTARRARSPYCCGGSRE
jgi:hypothetical protein